MKTKKILQTLALLALWQGSAHAALLPLQNASITATYNGAAAGMLALDHGFVAGPGGNTTTLDPTNSGVEFFTDDFLFGIDFDASGALTVIANAVAMPGAHSMRFDFGSSLANPISAFTLVGGAGISGLAGLSIVDAHTISLDLSAINWSEFGTLTAQLDAAPAAAVPEPAAPAIVLAGLAGMAFLRRNRKPRA